MQQILSILGALALCLAPFAPQSSAEAAARVFRFRGGGHIASATFSHTEGTLVTITDIFTIEGFNQAPPSEPTRSPTLLTGVVITQFDTTCPPEEGCPLTMDTFGFTEALMFQFDRKLSFADVEARVMMTDLVSGRRFPLAIDLNWIGIGETRHVGGSHRLGEPGVCIFITTGQNYFRLAEVSGSVIDLDTGFNFTLQAEAFAFLERASGNEIRVDLGCE